MATDIKFRAWDGTTMYSQHDCYFTFGRNENKVAGKYWSVYLYEQHGSDYCVDSTEENAVLMQFTGLLDKNDKEIYEGDIIQSLDSKGNKIMHVITYCDNECSYVSQHIPYNKYSPHSGLNQKWITEFSKEIVGNIYQNADLLKNA